MMRHFRDDPGRGEWTGRFELGRSVARQQSWDCGQAAQAQGAGVRARVADGLAEISVARVLDRSGLRLIHRGPVWLRGLDPGQKRRVLRAPGQGPSLAP
ncbi:MAG: hypothetical protein INF48_04770 [Rhodobacter sp.]|nr:hypothetical protein [Rhodobacter sp.]